MEFWGARCFIVVMCCYIPLLSPVTLQELTLTFLSKPERVGGHVREEGAEALALTASATFVEETLNNYADKLHEDRTFNDQAAWVGDQVGQANGEKDILTDGSVLRYVQKVIVPEQAVICFMGDIHGGMHSLIRNLWRLVALGYLNNDFTVRHPEFYLVILGDMVDRGRWGIETLLLLLSLKRANWNNVFMIAGNHETGTLPIEHGFKDEVEKKFEQPDLFWSVYKKLFITLPVALFIGNRHGMLQCCHGGIDARVKPSSFLENHQALFKNVGTEDECQGLFWNDFCSGERGGLKKSERGDDVYVADQSATLAYLRENNLVGIIRAHQDAEFGLKLFFPKNRGNNGYVDSDQLTMPYSYHGYADNGPYWYKQHALYHWKDVVSSFDITNNKFKFSTMDYYPVFTFSTCVESRKFPFDCCGLLHMQGASTQWYLEVIEAYLGTDYRDYPRDGKYVCLGVKDVPAHTTLVKPTKEQGIDPLHVTWHDDYDQKRLTAGLQRTLAESTKRQLVTNVLQKNVEASVGRQQAILQRMYQWLRHLRMKMREWLWRAIPIRI